MPRVTLALLSATLFAACTDPTDWSSVTAVAPPAATTTSEALPDWTAEPAELWVDGVFDGRPLSMRCSGDEVVGTRGVGDPAPTTLSCTDDGVKLLLIAQGPTATTYRDCDVQQVSVSLVATDDEDASARCASPDAGTFELSVVDLVESRDGDVWWAGDFDLIIDQGHHPADVVGGFRAASPRF